VFVFRRLGWEKLSTVFVFGGSILCGGGLSDEKETQMTFKKPKFRKDQVVFMDDLGFYGKIYEVLDHTPSGWEYLVQKSPSPLDRNYWYESDLRALTAKER
jgi:hypothetical protein